MFSTNLNLESMMLIIIIVSILPRSFMML